jgi:hypothetical protein
MIHAPTPHSGRGRRFGRLCRGLGPKRLLKRQSRHGGDNRATNVAVIAMDAHRVSTDLHLLHPTGTPWLARRYRLIRADTTLMKMVLVITGTTVGSRHSGPRTHQAAFIQRPTRVCWNLCQPDQLGQTLECPDSLVPLVANEVDQGHRNLRSHVGLG